MLDSLFVKDFAIVGAAEISFGTGLTVVTGETGAGKSLLVDALLLLAGSRADAGVVRHGCERAELVAEFRLEQVSTARAWLASEEFDDGEPRCQLRRVIRAEGSSRAWINGRPATLTQLGALSEHLIEIHGQHEHQALLEKSSQLALLDAYGNHVDVLAVVAARARRWREIDAQIRTLSGDADHAERCAFLEHQLAELDRHALTPLELDDLTDVHKRLANAGQLMQGCGGAAELLDGDSEFALLRLTARARNELRRLTEIDPRLAPIGELVDAAQIQLSEAGDSLARYRDALDLDPERLADVENQLAKLHELARKHRVPMADLKLRSEFLRKELQSLRGAGEALSALGQEREVVAVEYVTAAARLSTARTTAAERLAGDVTTLMDELGMAGGRFEASLEALDGTTPDPHGRERVEFLVSANPGQPPRPLRKVASGGELSRMSLAIEVAVLGLDEVGTMVFDEVDAGIGGAVAEVVGQKLRRLGGKRQVLCVTHLAQVAAQGHHHLRVAKSTDGKRTEINIATLDAKSRRDELARMLGGLEITRETLAHAQQMLEHAGRQTPDARR